MEIIYYLLKYFYYKVFGNFYSLGWKVGFSRGVDIKKGRYMSIGSNVFIGPNTLLQIPDEYKDLSKEEQEKSPKLIIEDKVTIGFGSMIDAIHHLKISENVLIGPLCFITDHGHNFSDPDQAVRFQGVTKVEPVVIEEGAWIGTKVTISPGVTIGKNAVVGANSVVTRDVPPFSVAAGVPARVLKKYDRKLKKWIKSA